MKFGKIRIALAMVLAFSMLFAAVGCGDTKPAESENVNESAYASAVELFNAVWDNTAKDFPAFGGNFEANVENAPGTINPADGDTMTNMLLIPEDVQEKVTDAATLFHMMNANTFTGAAIKLTDITVDDAAMKIKDSFKSNQFMCGMPDEIVIYAVGNDLIFYFGASDIMSEFKIATEKIDGAKLLIEENY